MFIVILTSKFSDTFHLSNCTATGLGVCHPLVLHLQVRTYYTDKTEAEYSLINQPRPCQIRIHSILEFGMRMNKVYSNVMHSSIICITCKYFSLAGHTRTLTVENYNFSSRVRSLIEQLMIMYVIIVLVGSKFFCYLRVHDV